MPENTINLKKKNKHLFKTQIFLWKIFKWMTVKSNDFIIKTYKHILSYKSLYLPLEIQTKCKWAFTEHLKHPFEDPTNSHHHHRQLQRESVVMQVVLWETSRNSSPVVSSNFQTSLVFRENHLPFSCHYHHHHEAPGSVLSTLYLLTLNPHKNPRR